ncbi:MAG: peptidase S10 [Candidatus Dormiibacterota bacterium]
MSDEEQPETPAVTSAALEEDLVERDGAVTVGRTRVPYRSQAGRLAVRDGAGKPKAHVFHIAYLRTGVEDTSQRPVVFAFNGGPGSSSAWLHLGLFGPRRVLLGDATTPPPPPYLPIENRHSVLDLADLVLIDPVSTGFSRAADGEEASQFHGLEEDTELVGEVIRLWTVRNGRWASPKFLIGESYGTTRAASVAEHLQRRHGMYLNGVALISSVLLFQTVRPGLGNDLAYALYLPSYATTAWNHHRVDRNRHGTLEGIADAAERFALGDYSRVLLLGSRATDAERTAVRDELAALTGLSPTFLEQVDLRIAPHRFFKELLRDQRRTVGRLDSRYTGIDADAAGDRPEYDPANAMIQGPYTAAVNHHLRVELGYESDLLYEVLNGEAVRPWKWGEANDGRYPEVGSRLRSAMSYNRGLRLFQAAGYFDLATPYAAAEWTLDHLGVDASLRQNVTTKRYQAGHMMYIHEPSLAQLRADLGRFVEGAIARQT